LQKKLHSSRNAHPLFHREVVGSRATSDASPSRPPPLRPTPALSASRWCTEVAARWSTCRPGAGERRICGDGQIEGPRPWHRRPTEPLLLRLHVEEHLRAEVAGTLCSASAGFVSPTPTLSPFMQRAQHLHQRAWSSSPPRPCRSGPAAASRGRGREEER
jgi:hypothetical protein